MSNDQTIFYHLLPQILCLGSAAALGSLQHTGELHTVPHADKAVMHVNVVIAEVPFFDCMSAETLGVLLCC